MSQAVPILSVLATAAVAILVPFIGAQLERRRLSVEGKRADREEARDVLDKAAAALGDCLTSVNEVFTRVEEALAPDSSSTDAGLAITATRELAQECRALVVHHRRVSIRLGPQDPVSTAYQAAYERIAELCDVLTDVLEGGPSSDSESWHEVIGVVHEVRGKAQSAEAAFLLETAAKLDPLRT